MNQPRLTCGIWEKSDLPFVDSARKTNTGSCVGDQWQLRISLLNGLRPNYYVQRSRRVESTAHLLVHGRRELVWVSCGKRQWMVVRLARPLTSKAAWVVCPRRWQT